MQEHNSNTSSGDVDYTDRPIPTDQRMARGNLMMAWWAVCSAIFYMVVAAAMARSYGTLNALIGIVLTVLCYSLVNALISRFAIRSGLTVALFSRLLFGHVGALIATLIFFATALYYAIFEGYVMALVLSEWSGSLSMTLATLLVVVIGVALIFGSVQHWLDKFNGVLLPVYVIGMLVAVGMAIAEFGYPSDWLTRVPEGGAPSLGWLHTFTYYMGVWVLMMFTFDYARFGRIEDESFHTRVTFGVPFYLMTFLFSGVAGILLDACLPSEGLSEASIVLGLLELMGIGGLALVWVTQSRINTANFYLATVNLQACINKLLGVRISKIITGCMVGALAWALMSADVFSYLLSALAYQGVFVVAWVGVALAHILTQPQVTPQSWDDGGLVSFRPCGVLSWALSTLVGIALMHSSLAGFSAVGTFIVAVLGYGIGSRLLAPRPSTTTDQH